VLTPSSKPSAPAAPVAADAAKAASPASDAKAAQAKSTDVKAADTKVAEAKAADTKTPDAKTAETKTAAAGYAVQLAAFADDKGANALAGRLKKAGHAAYTEPYSTSRGTLWRVRVGPFPTREAAEAARAKLKESGQNGIVAAAR
jgi:DedD protein